jgi:hypothetical protein
LFPQTSRRDCVQRGFSFFRIPEYIAKARRWGWGSETSLIAWFTFS